MSSKGKGKGSRCSCCLRPLGGPGGRCDECKALIRGLSEVRGASRTLTLNVPGHAQRIAEYTVRAALRLPLFE